MKCLKIELGILIVLFIITACSRVTSIQAKEELTTVSYEQEVLDHRAKLNEAYFNPKTSPLKPEQIETFKTLNGHKFFEIDSNYRVLAFLDRSSVEKNISFETSTDRVAVYDVYGTLKFTLDGKQYALKVFQSQTLSKAKEYRDHLFLPFTDLTSGEESYGGGRYIDLKTTKSDSIIIDFNRSYNPYCAYTVGYSCPVPPKENHLDTYIRAGIGYREK